MLLKYYQKIDEAISYLLSSAVDEKKLLERTFNKKKIILVDIGSNEGNFIDFLSDIFLFKKAFCFEPIKELSEKVKKKNILNNMTVSNVALSTGFIPNFLGFNLIVSNLLFSYHSPK